MPVKDPVRVTLSPFLAVGVAVQGSFVAAVEVVPFVVVLLLLPVFRVRIPLVKVAPVAVARKATPGTNFPVAEVIPTVAVPVRTVPAVEGVPAALVTTGLYPPA